MNKTVFTKASVKEFIDSQDVERRKDCRTISAMMRRVSGKRAAMLGESIVGFGQYYYKYASGREGIHCRIGFSPRKNDFTIYLMPGFKNQAKRLKKLGPHKHSVSCLYIKRLSDIDLEVLEEMVQVAFDDMAKMYPHDKKPKA